MQQKLASDKLFIAANNYVGKAKTKFAVVRYGNVMGSRGSIIPIFLQFKSQTHLPITDKRMTRFNITLNEAIKFVINCLKIIKGGEIFVPKIPSIKVTDLAKAIYPQKKLKIIGLRPGEKLHEEMVSTAESLNTIEYKNLLIICPQSSLIKWNKNFHKKNKPGSKNFKENASYNSLENKNFLSVNQIRDLLKKGKFI